MKTSDFARGSVNRYSGVRKGNAQWHILVTPPNMIIEQYYSNLLGFAFQTKFKQPLIQPQLKVDGTQSVDSQITHQRHIKLG